MDARKSEVASQSEIVNNSQIFFEVTGRPTCGRVLGMGVNAKPKDVYGPSSSSQCSKRCQVDRLKEKDFELHLKEIQDKSSIEKMKLEGTINRLKEEMPLIIANVLKKMGLISMQEPTTQVCLYIYIYIFSIININIFCYFLEVVEISCKVAHYRFKF